MNENFELQLQIEAMDCLLKNISPEMIQNQPSKVHPFSWYKASLIIGLGKENGS